jgi:hypothetical protein
LAEAMGLGDCLQESSASADQKKHSEKIRCDL